MTEDNFDASALLMRDHYDGKPGNVYQGDGDFEEPFPESAPEFTPLKVYLRATGLWYPSKTAVEGEAIWKLSLIHI